MSLFYYYPSLSMRRFNRYYDDIKSSQGDLDELSVFRVRRGDGE